MRKTMFFFIAISLVLLLSGCNEEKINEGFYIISDQVQVPENTNTEKETLVANKTILKIYYPDETKQFIRSKMIEVEEINKDTIMEHILEMGYLEEPTKLFQLSGENYTEEGKLLKAEFSSTLAKELYSLTAEEGQIVYACLVNTLLDAYGAIGVSIFVGNEVMPYPETDINLVREAVVLPEGYYSHFALSRENKMEIPFVFQEITTNIMYTRFFCEDGYAIYYESDYYDASYQKEEEVAVFQKKDGLVSFYIILSDSSKLDSIERILNEEVVGALEISEPLEIEIGANGYQATAIYKKAETQTNNFYVIEKEGQIFVIETNFLQGSTLEDEKRVDQMLESFQLIK